MKRFLNAWYGGCIFKSLNTFQKIKELIKTPRQRKFFYQRFIRGFSDDDLWNLDKTIAEFILPRLKRFKEIQCGHPSEMTEKEWKETLDKMIYAFEETKNQFTPISEQYKRDKIREGLKLFIYYYEGLWD